MAYINCHGDTLTLHFTSRPPSTPLVSAMTEVTTSHSHPRCAQSCSRRNLAMSDALRRVENLSPSGSADLESIRQSTGRYVCFPGILRLTTMLLPDRGSARMHWHTAGSSWPWGLRKYKFPPVSLFAQVLCTQLDNWPWGLCKYTFPLSACLHRC